MNSSKKLKKLLIYAPHLKLLTCTKYTGIVVVEGSFRDLTFNYTS